MDEYKIVSPPIQIWSFVTHANKNVYLDDYVYQEKSSYFVEKIRKNI